MYWHRICLGRRKKSSRRTHIPATRSLVRDSNPRPSKYKARTRTSTARCADFSTVFVKRMAQYREGWQTTRLRVKLSKDSVACVGIRGVKTE